jgi:hypothetical protein
MTIELLQDANEVLNDCGRPQLPRGVVCVPLPKSYLMQFAFPALASMASQTITREITPPSNAKVIPNAWSLRSIQASQPVSCLLQVQLPDGRFLFNNPITIGEITGSGSYRFPFTDEDDYPLGTKLQVTLNNTNLPLGQAISFLFEGAYKTFLKGSPGMVINDGGCLPRYQGFPSQNIMAPSWMAGSYPRALPGCVDIEEYTFASNIETLGAANVASPLIQIDPATDFAARRMYFQLVPSDTITGVTVLVRPRSGSGYAFADDFLISSYIANAPWPKDWDLSAGDDVYFDLQVVDFVGTGTFTFQCFLEGVKRGRG